MKKFADVVADAILATEASRLDKIMADVTRNITYDFAEATYSLMDDYYFDYTPIQYVRKHTRKKFLRGGRTSKKSPADRISLHSAITKQGETKEGNIGPVIGTYGGSLYEGYYAGISFDEEYFNKRDSMYHGDKDKNEKGIEEWDIVKNFLFAGEGIGKGDIRSHPAISGVEYSAPSADKMLNAMLQAYKPRFDEHYQNALRKNK